jgi:MFS family permease
MRPVGVIARYIVLGAVLGLPAGLAWWLLAPRVAVRADDPEALVESYPEGFIGADLTLGIALAVVGLILGTAASRRLYRTGFVRGWAQVAGVIVGGLAAAGVAWLLGWWLAGGGQPRTSGEALLPLTLNAGGVLLLAVVSGLLVVILATAFARDPQLEPPSAAPPVG